ncbi:MAG TPA: antitoxin [Elusimicrobia bacterium]|jgi:predicted DNA binding CopG/RHH family protein|nr:antitoxin [Elusimicrobiota bacterium]
MRKEYDFSKSKRNPYAKALKRQITIRLDQPTIEYFQQLAGTSGLPYQSLMNLYLRDCASHHRTLHMNWAA